MSSRNKLLLPEERISAARINRALELARHKVGKVPVELLIQDTLSYLDKDPLIKTEYFEIVDEIDLVPIPDWDQTDGIRGCIAAVIGNVRLIDNMDFSL